MVTNILNSIKNYIKKSCFWNYKLKLQDLFVKFVDARHLRDGLIDYGFLIKLLDKDKKYYSQLGQDLFLDKFIFNNKKDGFYLDIGANHPTISNNSKYFEEIGWNGIAIEPQTKFNDLWAKRSAKLINVAVGVSEGEVTFAEYKSEDELGVMVGAAAALGRNASEKKFVVRQRRIDNILKEQGIKHIDFVSLDVEGYELNALRSIDFDDVKIDCFVIENNKGLWGCAQRNIRSFMKRKGYKLIARLKIDDIFVRKDLIKLENTSVE